MNDKKTQRFGVIDLGTNAVRFEIYEFTHNFPQRIHQQRLVLRLGEHLESTKRINPAAVEPLLQATEEFVSLCKSSDVRGIAAAGTSVFREAEDGEDLKRKILERSGVEVEIVTGEREAELIAKGILNFEQALPAQALLVDIGGGSTELTLLRDSESVFSTSLAIGAIRAQRSFLRHSPPAPDTITQLRSVVRGHLYSLATPVIESKPQLAICSSGTARALSDLAQAEQFSAHWLSSTISMLSTLQLEAICSLTSLKEERADIILAGAVILDEILANTGTPAIRVSQFSLRHGLLLECRVRYEARGA